MKGLITVLAVLVVVGLAYFLYRTPSAPPEMTAADRAAIEAELAQEFDAYADVVRGLDHNALMGFFQQREDFVWAHNGVLTTSWESLSEVSGQAWAAWASVESFGWGDLHIQVLAPNIAVVATTFALPPRTLPGLRWSPRGGSRPCGSTRMASGRS